MIANALGELREHVVFLGGAVVGLLVSDPLAESVRATYDVDAVVNLDWSRFRGIEARVESQGFARAMQPNRSAQASCFSAYVPLHQSSCDIVGFKSAKKTLKHRGPLAMMHRNCNALGLP